MNQRYRIFCLIIILVLSLSACNMPMASPSVPFITPTPFLGAVTPALPTSTPAPPPDATDPPAPAETQTVPTVVPATRGPRILKVVFIQDGNVWLWQEDTNNPLALSQAGEVTSVEISEDGNRVAFLRQVDDFHSELWMVSSDGSGEQVLVSAEQFEALEITNRDANAVSIIPHLFQWEPGLPNVVFNTQQLFQGVGQNLSDDLWRVNTETLEVTNVLPGGSGGEFYYSPDGSQIAIVQPEAISLVNADGSNRRENVMVYPMVITYSEYLYYPKPVWSRDSTSLRLALPPADPLAEPAQPTTIWHIAADGFPASQIASFVAAPFFGSEVAFSPDLSRLAIIREVPELDANVRDLHITTAEGQPLPGMSETRYDRGPLLDFRGWSPDSAHFIFLPGENRALQIGEMGAAPVSLGFTGGFEITWTDTLHFLNVQENDGKLSLNLTGIDGSTIVIAEDINFPIDYEFR